jgi:hypothetical protein
MMDIDNISCQINNWFAKKRLNGVLVFSFTSYSELKESVIIEQQGRYNYSQLNCDVNGKKISNCNVFLLLFCFEFGWSKL